MLWLSEDAIQYAVSRCNRCENFKVVIASSDIRLRRNIYELAKKIHSELKNGVQIIGHARHRNDLTIDFQNGSRINIMSASKNARGHKCHLLIVPKNTDYAVLNEVLRPMEILGLEDWEEDWRREYVPIWGESGERSQIPDKIPTIDEEEFDKILNGTTMGENNYTHDNTWDTVMQKINNLSRKKLEKCDVYIFDIKLCDNEIDKDFDVFSEKSLEKLGELFVGRTGIVEPCSRFGDQTARIYETWIEKTPEKLTSYGMPYVALKASAYVLRIPNTRDLIHKLETGNIKEVSIGCSVEKEICSICGENVMRAECSHTKSCTYSSNICYHILESPTDAYEWSFVATTY